MDERLKRGSSTSEAEEPKTQQAENQRDKGQEQNKEGYKQVQPNMTGLAGNVFSHFCR